jgi:hypothetical protein
MIAGMQLGADRVAGLEVHAAVGSGAHGLEVGGRFPGPGAPVAHEDVLRNDEPPAATEWLGPERRGLLEDDLDGMLAELLHALEIAVQRDAGRGRGGIGGELPGEHDIVRREGSRVVPLDTPLERPDDPRTILRDAALLQAR